MSDSLSGRAVLVTGGTKGLGRALAAAYRTAGADVLVCARNAPEESLPAGIDFVSADLRDAGAAAGVVDAVMSAFGAMRCASQHGTVLSPHSARACSGHRLRDDETSGDESLA